MREFTKQARVYSMDCGLRGPSLEDVVHSITMAVGHEMEQWLRTLQKLFFRPNLFRARSPIWAAGMVLVKIDRNPGRVVLMCKEAWMNLQLSTFLLSPRYRQVPTAVPMAGFANLMRDSFRRQVSGDLSWIGMLGCRKCHRPTRSNRRVCWHLQIWSSR